MDLTSLNFRLSTVDVTIGQPGSGGLIYARNYQQIGWRDNFVGTLKSASSVYTVSFGGASEIFTLTSGVYVSDQAVGSTLTYDSGTQVYTYRSGSGVVALFSKALAETAPLEANEGKVISITLPSGEKTTFTYRAVTISSVTYNRLQSVTNNFGYQLKFKYDEDNPTVVGDLLDFRLVTKVTGLNSAVDYCDPAADSCTYSQTWPNATYATVPGTPTYQTVTDTLGQVTRFTFDTSARITGIRRPSAVSDTTTITYSTVERVSTISNGTGTWTYGRSLVVGSGVRTTVTDPLSHTRKVVFDPVSLLVGSDMDGLDREVAYQYDAYGRTIRATSPEGDYVQYAYDARGNVTTTTRVPKSGSGLANIVTSATYDTTCTLAVKCNQPNTTVDANGAVTDYTYDTTHGGVLTVTEPAPVTLGTRPETRYSYTSLNAYYKNSGGTIVAAPTAVYRLTGVSACATGSSCSGAAAEVKSTIAYGSTGVANNLLPTSISSGSGDGILTAQAITTYDAVGDTVSIDGPLLGTTDTVRYRYDLGRRLVGVVGPDPDAAGALKNRGTRTSYNLDGQVTLIEAINVNSQSDGDWASPTVLEQQTLAYDSVGRLVKSSLVTGGATQAAIQYSYDNANRLDCTALRMNPSIFNSLPASACTLGTTGANGADRITKNTYSAADEVTKVTTSYGTGEQADDATLTYNNWGLTATLADALGGLTTYEYDGFGRAKKVRYPIAGSRTASSATDYEEYTYDAYGNVSLQRRRDSQAFGFAYDKLGRPVTLDAPIGMDDVTYAYDNLDRRTSVSITGHALTYGWDALGRQISATSPIGTTAYTYDLAGSRTSMAWPDTFKIVYDYDQTGAVTAIREDGVTTGVGVLATFAYDALGRRATLTRGNGVTTTYTFDTASRLTSLVHNLTGTTSDQTYTLTWNAAFEALTRTGSNSTYATSAPANGTRAYSSNGLNQLTTSGSLSLSYDGRGNLTSDGVNAYSYDAANRLTGMSGVTLAYDPSGRLYQTVGSATTRFGYDGVELAGEYDSSSQLLRRYVQGPGSDEPIVWYEGTGTSDRRWLVADQLGSVVAVANGSGAASSINRYDEYGVPGSSNVGRFQYTGQAWIPEIGLYHYKARVYSPTLGRFLQPDPVGYDDGTNIYAYVHNDPVNATDPSGLGAPGALCEEGSPGCGHADMPDTVAGGPGSVPSCNSGWACVIRLWPYTPYALAYADRSSAHPGSGYGKGSGKCASRYMTLAGSLGGTVFYFFTGQNASVNGQLNIPLDLKLRGTQFGFSAQGGELTGLGLYGGGGLSLSAGGATESMTPGFSDFTFKQGEANVAWAGRSFGAAGQYSTSSNGAINGAAMSKGVAPKLGIGGGAMAGGGSGAGRQWATGTFNCNSGR